MDPSNSRALVGVSVVLGSGPHPPRRTGPCGCSSSTMLQAAVG
jgi:hypothetical protein